MVVIGREATRRDRLTIFQRFFNNSNGSKMHKIFKTRIYAARPSTKPLALLISLLLPLSMSCKSNPIELPAGLLLGKVTFPDGKPVPEVSVNAVQISSDPTNRITSQTNAKGEYGF